MSALEIVRATEADIPFIMATERLPGNEGLVGRWEREEHERALGDPGNAYFVGLADGTAVGFVIVQHWASANRATLIRRIIVADRGRKIGRELLSKVIDAILAETDASRVWLNVFSAQRTRATGLQRARISLRGAREVSGDRGEQGAADGAAAAGLAATAAPAIPADWELPTARSCLKRVFARTGVHRQAELGALVGGVSLPDCGSRRFS